MKKISIFIFALLFAGTIAAQTNRGVKITKHCECDDNNNHSYATGHAVQDEQIDPESSIYPIEYLAYRRAIDLLADKISFSFIIKDGKYAVENSQEYFKNYLERLTIANNYSEIVCKESLTTENGKEEIFIGVKISQTYTGEKEFDEEKFRKKLGRETQKKFKEENSKKE